MKWNSQPVRLIVNRLYGHFYTVIFIIIIITITYDKRKRVWINGFSVAQSTESNKDNNNWQRVAEGDRFLIVLSLDEEKNKKIWNGYSNTEEEEENEDAEMPCLMAYRSLSSSSTVVSVIRRRRDIIIPEDHTGVSFNLAIWLGSEFSAVTGIPEQRYRRSKRKWGEKNGLTGEIACSISSYMWLHWVYKYQ